MVSHRNGFICCFKQWLKKATKQHSLFNILQQALLILFAFHKIHFLQTFYGNDYTQGQQVYVWWMKDLNCELSSAQVVISSSLLAAGCYIACRRLKTPSCTRVQLMECDNNS